MSCWRHYQENVMLFWGLARGFMFRVDKTFSCSTLQSMKFQLQVWDGKSIHAQLHKKVQLDLSLNKHYSIDSDENHKLIKLQNIYFIKRKRSLMVFRERRGFYVFPLTLGLKKGVLTLARPTLNFCGDPATFIAILQKKKTSHTERSFWISFF